MIRTNGATRRKRGARRRAADAVELAFLAPVVLLVGLVLLVPTASVVYHAFTDWQLGAPSPWVGLKNFQDLFASSTFRQILRNQVVLLVIGLPFWTVVPLLLSLLLFERVPAPGLFRMILFFPVVVPAAVVGILFTFILAPTGPLNAFLGSIGLDGAQRNWLLDEDVVRPTIVAVLGWGTVGTGVIIFTAALATVPLELLEAAAIDGAGWWRRLWHVVLPSLARIVELWLVLLVITAFVGIFPWIFALTRGGPGYTTTTIDFDIWQNALNFGYFGTAAAEAVILLLVVGLVIGGASALRTLVARVRRST